MKRTNESELKATIKRVKDAEKAIDSAIKDLQEKQSQMLMMIAQIQQKLLTSVPTESRPSHRKEAATADKMLNPVSFWQEVIQQNYALWHDAIRHIQPLVNQPYPNTEVNPRIRISG